jgi:hypothetical protein
MYIHPVFTIFEGQKIFFSPEFLHENICCRLFFQQKSNSDYDK